MTEPGSAPPSYAGLATRTLAFAIDAAVINVVAWFVGAVCALGAVAAVAARRAC